MEAAKLAIDSKLLETSINGATGIIMNVTGGPDMTLFEVNEAANVIHDAVADDADVIFGAVVDDSLQGDIQITIIATGFELKNGEVVAPATNNASNKQVFTPGLFDNFTSSGFSSSETPSFNFTPQTKPEKRETPPMPSPAADDGLNIPEFLNPRNRLG
jgi:cell division protein FtsZ